MVTKETGSLESQNIIADSKALVLDGFSMNYYSILALRDFENYLSQLSHFIYGETKA